MKNETETMKAAREAIEFMGGVAEFRRDVQGDLDDYPPGTMGHAVAEVLLAGIEAATATVSCLACYGAGRSRYGDPCTPCGGSGRRFADGGGRAIVTPLHQSAGVQGAAEATISDGSLVQQAEHPPEASPTRGHKMRDPGSSPGGANLIEAATAEQPAADELFLSGQVAKLRAERDELLEIINDSFCMLHCPKSTLAFDGRNLRPHVEASAVAALDYRAERDALKAKLAALASAVETLGGRGCIVVENAADKMARKVANEALRAAREVL